MPTAIAAIWSSDTALKDNPVFVFWKKNAKTTISDPATNDAKISNFGIKISNQGTWSDTNIGAGSRRPISRNLLICSPWTSESQMNCEKPSWKVAKPTVAINKARRSWFANGLITYRSVATPNITIMPAAMNNAVQKSIPFSVILTKVKEANKSMVPWAKLNIPDDL